MATFARLLCVAALMLAVAAAQCNEVRAFYGTSTCTTGTYWYYNTGVCYSNTWSAVQSGGRTFSGSSCKYNSATNAWQGFTDGNCQTLSWSATGLLCNQCYSGLNGATWFINGDQITHQIAVAESATNATARSVDGQPARRGMLPPLPKAQGEPAKKLNF